MSDPTGPYTPSLQEPSKDVGADLAPTLDGPRLRFGKAVELRRVCLNCGAKKHVKYRSTEFEYIPSAAWLAFLFIGVVWAWLLRSPSHRARVRIPRCQSCERREENIRFLRGPAILVLVVVLLFAATLAGNGLPMSGAIVAVLAVPAFVLSYRRWLGGAIRAAYIDEGTVTLRGIHPAALVALTAPRATSARGNSDNNRDDPKPSGG